MVIDCTVMGASPPTSTLPTLIWRVLRRGAAVRLGPITGSRLGGGASGAAMDGRPPEPRGGGHGAGGGDPTGVPPAVRERQDGATEPITGTGCSTASRCPDTTN